MLPSSNCTSKADISIDYIDLSNANLSKADISIDNIDLSSKAKLTNAPAYYKDNRTFKMLNYKDSIIEYRLLENIRSTILV